MVIHNCQLLLEKHPKKLVTRSPQATTLTITSSFVVLTKIKVALKNIRYVSTFDCRVLALYSILPSIYVNFYVVAAAVIPRSDNTTVLHVLPTILLTDAYSAFTHASSFKNQAKQKRNTGGREEAQLR